jgi:hypothetical protein
MTVPFFCEYKAYGAPHGLKLAVALPGLKH